MASNSACDIGLRIKERVNERERERVSYKFDTTAFNTRNCQNGQNDHLNIFVYFVYLDVL